MTQEFVKLPREVVEWAIKALICTDSEEGSTAYKNELEAIKKLRAALKQPQNHVPDAGNMAPAGWKLVPVEPTHDMQEAGIDAHYEAEKKMQEPNAWEPGGFAERKVRASHVYRSMLSAAPQPPTTEQSSAVEQPQVEQEPALVVAYDKQGWRQMLDDMREIPDGTPLYANPQRKREPLTIEQPQAEQPAMTPIAQRKLDSLLAEGYTISGYSIYHEQKHQHGFVTGAGLVGWWKPEGMEYPQPLGDQEPVAWIENLVGALSYNPHHEAARKLPEGVRFDLYTRPHPRQPLNDDEILHTGIPEQLWFAKRFGSAPADWTDEQIRTHNFFQSAVTQLVRAIERAHGIK